MGDHETKLGTVRTPQEKAAEMFPNNTRITQIDARNKAMLEAAAAFRKGLKNGTVTLAELPVLKRKYPSFGVMPCRAAGIEFVMFHAHDDVVVMDYLWHGEDGYEPEFVETWVSWCKTPGVVLDIGAYSGLMSILAARAHPENEVHLFEPLDRVIERANVNIKLNGLGPRITQHAFAASDSEGKVEMNLFRNENTLGTGNSIYVKEGLPSFGTRTIRTIAIDSYLPDIMPTAIKVDVEGHELPCLKGMHNTITRARPNMMIEVWEHTRAEVLALMEAHGYDMRRVEPRDRGVNNYIATPR